MYNKLNKTAIFFQGVSDPVGDLNPLEKMNMMMDQKVGLCI